VKVMMDFRSALYNVNKELANEYGDQIDALVVMANMTGVKVWSDGASGVMRTYFLIDPKEGAGQEVLFVAIIDLQINKCYIEPRTNEMTVGVNNAIAQSASHKLTTMSELLAVAEQLIVKRSVEKLL
jgi:hypothetical protein